MFSIVSMPEQSSKVFNTIIYILTVNTQRKCKKTGKEYIIKITAARQMGTDRK